MPAKRILLVDDEVPLRRSLSQLLKMRGYEVTTAADGRGAIKAARMQKPDLVITDIMMPEQDGLEVVRELRTVAPDVPIICISGGGVWQLTNMLDVAKAFGASRTMAKPIHAKDLWTAVEELLSKEPQRRENPPA